MAWPVVTADFGRPEQAIRWFLKRHPALAKDLPRARHYAGERAWWVAGAVRLDVAVATWQGLARALERGTSLSDFKREVREELERDWGRKDSARLETIFRTNTQKAYNAGRHREMTDPAVLPLRPFWMYDAILDSRTTPICKKRDRVLLRADDPWWASNHPPLHHRCRSSLRSLRVKDAQRRGGEKRPPEDAEAPGESFGLAPEHDVPWRPDHKRVPRELWDAYAAKGSPVRGHAGEAKWGHKGRKGAPPWYVDDDTERSGHVRAARGAEWLNRELFTAEYLADQGNRVVKLPERRDAREKSVDVRMNGRPELVELKRPESGSKNALQQNLRRAGNQGSAVILDVRGLGVDRGLFAQVLRGLLATTLARLAYVRFIGDDYDLTFEVE